MLVLGDYQKFDLDLDSDTHSISFLMRSNHGDSVTSRCIVYLFCFSIIQAKSCVVCGLCPSPLLFADYERAPSLPHCYGNPTLHSFTARVCMWPQALGRQTRKQEGGVAFSNTLTTSRQQQRTALAVQTEDSRSEKKK